MSKKLFFIPLLLFVYQFGFSQDFQGKAVYQSKTTMDMDFGGRQMSEDQKKMIKERMKSFLEKSFILTFDRTSATYLEEEKLEQPGGGGVNFRAFGMGSGKYYKNIQEQAYTNQTEMFGKVFLIKDSLKTLDWKLSSESRKIGNYTCYKATAVKAVDSTDFSNFRRRGPRGNRGSRGTRGTEAEAEEATQKQDSTAKEDKEDSLFSRIEIPKEIEITAWYTPEIPISMGPGEYWGLPGLILEVSSGRTTILCSKIVMNPEEKVFIEAPTKGKEVTQEAYNKIMMDKVKEMSERFGRGNRRGNGGGFRIRN